MTGKRKYSIEALQAVLVKLKNNNGNSIEKIVRKFDVPESTLWNYWKNPDLSFQHGPPLLLSKNEESALIKHVNQICTLNLTISFHEFKNKVIELM